MASIKRRPDGKWRARYRDNFGKEHARHFSRKVDAEAWLNEVTASLVRGDWVDPKRADVTIAAVAQTWLLNPKWKPSTRSRNQSILDNHVLPKWGTMKLPDVQHDDLQAWVIELTATGMASNTVRKVAGVLSGVLTVATLAKRMPSNPMENVSLPEPSVTRRRYLDDVQVQSLAHASGENATIVYVLAYCGLRIGELSALQVGNVDLRRRRLLIEQAMTEVNGVAIVDSPKDYQRRSVPWPSFLDESMVSIVTGRHPDEYLFQSPRGGVLRVRNMRRAWFDAAAVTAGVPGLTPHELRHTAASLAVHAGASVLAVQRMLGHEKPSVTLDVYADLFDQDLDVLADNLASARTQALADSVRTGRDTSGELTNLASL